MTVLVVHHPACFEHDTGVHPERIDRLRVIQKALHQADHLPQKWEEARAATLEDLLTCHTERHCRLILSLEGQSLAIDADTYMSPGTVKAALHAAGAGLTAVDRLLGSQEFRTAFLPVRPPGHHATPDRAMGFCIFNNAAIAARYCQRAHGIEKVLIVDWDVHHGNGTQEIFYEDPTVFYYSLHLAPHYPGTGREEERGKGKGLDTTLNRPLPYRYPAKHYLAIFEEDLQKIFESFKPQLVIISAGFDSHRQDPLGGLSLTEADYRKMGSLLRDCAENRPILSFLEGGYNLMRLGSSVVAHLEGLEEGPSAPTT